LQVAALLTQLCARPVGRATWVKGAKGTCMMRDKGKGLATVIPEACLREGLLSDPDTKLDRAVQARIGDQLRAMYDDLMQQPIPDRFKDLLSRLDQERQEEPE
jgi:Anti-sigma factor NepR